MTLSSTQTRTTYAGDGATANFAVPFAFFGPEELTVIEQMPGDGAKIALTLGSHYTVAGGNGDTGTVSAVVPPAAGASWTILRKTNRTQLVDYTPNDPFPAETLERALDRQAAVSQELDDALARSAQLSPTTVLDALEMPDPEANRFLRWNSSADGLENAEVQSSSSVIQASGDATGIVELATASETRTGLDAERAVTPAGMASLWRKGADLASASMLAKPVDADLGGYHVVTGTATIAGLWTGEADGTEIELRFAAACDLTHHATDFILPAGASVTAQPGEVARFRSESDKWRCVSAPPNWYVSPTPSFSANKGGVDQTGIPSATSTKITFTSESWDLGGYYDAVNSRFTPPAGKYQFNIGVFFKAGVVDQSLYFAAVYKNGINAGCGSQLTASGMGGVGVNISIILEANGADYFEAHCEGFGTGDKTISGAASNTYFQAVKIA